MKVFVMLICFAMLGCSATMPLVQNETSQDEGRAGLYEVANSGFDQFYIADASALAKYVSLSFQPLDLTNLKIDQRRLDIHDRTWKFSKREKEILTKAFAKKTLSVFENVQEFTQVNSPGEGVLNVTFEFVEFAPNASKDDGITRGIRDKVWTRSVGDLKMIARLEDSVTGELVAVLEDEDRVGDSSFFERNNRVNNTRKLKLTMEKWLTRLKHTLVELKT